tara:strand:- start:24993 stop:25478 length:486 start_codon:yes stop_codon:yes gene_type:complete
MNVFTKRASLEDEDRIKKFISKAIASNCFQHELVNNQHNIDFIYSTDIRPALVNDDPIVFGLEDGKSIGISCISTCANQLYHLKSITAVGLFTYVEPEYRSQGVAYMMHQHCFNLLKEKGVERVIGEILNSNQDSINSCNFLSKKINAEYNIYSSKYECRI